MYIVLYFVFGKLLPSVGLRSEGLGFLISVVLFFLYYFWHFEENRISWLKPRLQQSFNNLEKIFLSRTGYNNALLFSVVTVICHWIFSIFMFANVPNNSDVVFFPFVENPIISLYFWWFFNPTLCLLTFVEIRKVTIGTTILFRVRN